MGQELFVFTRPRAAMPSSGRVYPLNVHGTVVYLTYVEHLITGQINFVIAVLSGFVWMLLARREARHDGSL